jgi:hypothetical protein
VVAVAALGALVIGVGAYVALDAARQMSEACGLGACWGPAPIVPPALPSTEQKQNQGAYTGDTEKLPALPQSPTPPEGPRIPWWLWLCGAAGMGLAGALQGDTPQPQPLPPTPLAPAAPSPSPLPSPPKGQFSALLEAGLAVLEQYEPAYAQLIRNGTIPLQEPRDGSTAAGGAGMSLSDRIIVFADPHFPGSTAVALYEEIYHQFQPAGNEQAIELEAKAAAAQWVMRNNIITNPVSGDIEAYKRGGIPELKKWLRDNYGYRSIAQGGLNGKIPNPIPKPSGLP